MCLLYSAKYSMVILLDSGALFLYWTFLYQECVSNNRGVVYDLIASHGDVEDMVFFAVLMQGKNQL